MVHRSRSTYDTNGFHRSCVLAKTRKGCVWFSGLYAKKFLQYYICLLRLTRDCYIHIQDEVSVSLWYDAIILNNLVSESIFAYTTLQFQSLDRTAVITRGAMDGCGGADLGLIMGWPTLRAQSL